MPVVSSIVVEEGVEDSNGQKWLRFEFTLSDGSVDGHYGYRRYPVATNAETQRLALIAPLNESLAETERKFAFNYGMGGGDIDVYPWTENLLADIQKYFWRRFFGFLRAESTDPMIRRRPDLLTTAMVPGSYVNKHSATAIRAFLGDPSWSNTDISNAIAKATSFYTGVTDLDHGKGEVGR